MPDKFIQMSLQVVISMYFQVVISMYFQVVIAMYFQVQTMLQQIKVMQECNFQVHALTRSYTFNGNDAEALHKIQVEKVAIYY